jgi:Uma2 family endonuclease
MSVDEYLRTSFDDADREYLDGEVVERNRGSLTHSKLQGQIYFLLRSIGAPAGLFVALELRNRVMVNRYRIPDIAVYSSEPREQVPSEPPLVTIEVLSPDDRFSYLGPKLSEYRHWGVRHIWIVDPEAQRLTTYDANGLNDVEEFTLPEFGITLTRSDIFS